MAQCNPTQARAGKARRFNVTVVRKGFLRHTATLHDRLDVGWVGLDFKMFTSHGASLAAWAHAARILEREASFDFRGYSVV
ncbi:hypothetical protein ABIB75_001047 [Bradyrhizobium sp. GM2.2]|uniref:hypothetical protein n=1 Tax=Bradyrhizobium sp. GM2.2 TaxID=3156358 RepID=UPI00339A40C6